MIGVLIFATVHGVRAVHRGDIHELGHYPGRASLWRRHRLLLDRLWPQDRRVARQDRRRVADRRDSPGRLCPVLGRRQRRQRARRQRPGRLMQEIADREGEAAVSRYYHFKPVWQRAIIAVAGPVANFLLAIAVLAVFMATIGEIRNPARVYGVSPGSAAAAAGFKPGRRHPQGRRPQDPDVPGSERLRHAARQAADRFHRQRGPATIHLTGRRARSRFRTRSTAA
jgi:hypothetical protein